MNKEELTPWIERLNAEPDGKKRNEIVAELCKEKSLKIGDAWKFLKEAGFDPKTRPEKSETAETRAGTAEGTAQAEAEAKKETAVIRHKTPYEQYRCAGLALTQKPKAYQVTKAQLEKLRNDPWVVIDDGKEGGKGE
jgi:hypothetical protein